MDTKTFILLIIALIVFTFCFICYVGIKYNVAELQEENDKLKKDIKRIRKEEK